MGSYRCTLSFRTFCVVLGTAPVILGGCREPTPPETVTRYALRSVDGQSLPAVVGQGGSFTVWVVRGEATIGPANDFTFAISDSSDSPLMPVPTETDSLAGRYSLSGDQLVISFAPPESGATYADTGALSAGRDTLRIRTHYPVGMSGGPSTRLLLYTKQ